MLSVRSDLAIEAQASARGATWLARQLVSKAPSDLADSGFGHEVRAALERRAEHLASEGLARRENQRLVFARDLLNTLRARDVEAVAERLTAETGLVHRPLQAGDLASGTYKQRLALSSGRFAMLSDGLGFQLVPWTPSLERQLGRHVTGSIMPGGGVDWSFGRKRGLAI